MTEPPRIVVHCLDHARAALAAAAEAGLAVVLLSPPAAAGYAGTPFFVEVARQARAEFPKAVSLLAVDCGDAPGHALAALRQGAEAVVLRAEPDVLARVADIAAQCGARLLAPDPPALDLLEAAQPLAACRDWLAARSA